jgi:hypothetical protein
MNAASAVLLIAISVLAHATMPVASMALGESCASPRPGRAQSTQGTRMPVHSTDGVSVNVTCAQPVAASTGEKIPNGQEVAQATQPPAHDHGVVLPVAQHDQGGSAAAGSSNTATSDAAALAARQRGNQRPSSASPDERGGPSASDSSEITALFSGLVRLIAACVVAYVAWRLVQRSITMFGALFDGDALQPSTQRHGASASTSRHGDSGAMPRSAEGAPAPRSAEGASMQRPYGSSRPLAARPGPFAFTHHWGGFGGASTGWYLSKELMQLVVALMLAVVAALLALALLTLAFNPIGGTQPPPTEKPASGATHAAAPRD